MNGNGQIIELLWIVEMQVVEVMVLPAHEMCGSLRPAPTLRQSGFWALQPDWPSYREFRDVVFQDMGFENNSLSTLKNWRCGDFTPKADMGEGFKTSMLKPHILKHHIPEHPILACAQEKLLRWFGPDFAGGTSWWILCSFVCVLCL